MATDDCDICLLYVRLKHPTTDTLNRALLESKLCSTILNYDIIRTSPTPAFRVKIRKSLLHNAITHARTNQCVADIWGGTTAPSLPRAARTPSTTHYAAGEQQSLTITCWNCRGLSTGIPYLNHILDSGSDIVVLSEHWLWPYELHKLSEIHPGYQGMGVADSRLTETSDNLQRGCGGVGMVWKKSLDVTPMMDIQSDRICGIRIKKSSENDDTWISVIGVYLPCLDLGVDLYRDSLIELERVISESECWGPVIVAGDFNAHLGPTWGTRAHSDPNLQGILSWYMDYRSSIRLRQHVSYSFPLGRGVRQGSILSPALFLLVMDPLLRHLQSQSIGASVNSTYAGGYLHADDIRTLASNPTTLEAQISPVTKFTKENFLSLNASKCEVVVFNKSTIKTFDKNLVFEAYSFPVKEEAKCLGYLWKQNLSSLPMIEDRIQKARKAFFQLGSVYAFQGSLSPVSASAIVQTCVLPILLYGVENWVMSSESTKKLERFQGEVAKRILQMPKWYSNKAACIVLGWNSIHSMCTIRKLKFLHRVMSNEESICYRAFSAMVDDVEALSLVRECRELEERYSSNFTTQILEAAEHLDGVCVLREAEKYIIKKDQASLLAEV